MIELPLTIEQTRAIRRGAESIELSEQQALSVRGAITAASGGGRPKDSDRCACGAMTRARAAKRGHRCAD